MTRRFSFPKAVANKSTTFLESIEATLEPKETMIKPLVPGALTNSSNSAGSGLEPSTLSGPTMIWSVHKREKTK